MLRTAVLGLLLIVSPIWCEPLSAADPELKMKVLVPAYFYPGGEGLQKWRTLIASAAQAPIVAIANPDSGPGKKIDENYREVFKLAKGSKITLIGYVTLSYAQRPVSAVKGDIDSWVHFHPEVQGIFFDEQPSEAEHAPFALECFDHARKTIRNATVVSNPGVPCAKEYLARKDYPTVCLFEHQDGFDAHRPPAWTADLPADRFATLLYNTRTADDMKRQFQQVVRNRSGYVFITDAANPMPWGRLPSYWDEELKLVRDANGQ
ncbi:MAG: spherulation-specific family 4 protein [Candidatus Saccharimonas sp.]|nr:spherulation-specific family 4 protein [Planctomycetaceae bacterium]